MRFRESSELELGEYSKLVVINEDAKSLDDHLLSAIGTSAFELCKCLVRRYSNGTQYSALQVFVTMIHTSSTWYVFPALRETCYREMCLFSPTEEKPGVPYRRSLNGELSERTRSEGT